MKKFRSKVVITFTPNVIEARDYPQYILKLKDSFFKDMGFFIHDSEIREVSILPSANDHTRNQLDRTGVKDEH